MVAAGSGSSPRKVSLFHSPLFTLSCFFDGIALHASDAKRHLLHHWILASTIAACIASFVAFLHTPPMRFEGVRDTIVAEGTFALYWFVLGVLSTVGVGSGFHTFILYLAPHILRVAAAAYGSDSVAFSARISRFVTLPPASWDIVGLSAALTPTYAIDAWQITTTTTSPSSSPPSHWAVYHLIMWPVFLWGMGTSVGEWPPFFFARAAARAGRAVTELKAVGEVRDVLRAKRGGIKGTTTFLSKPKTTTTTATTRVRTSERAAVIVVSTVETYGFWAVVAFSSIPNPLFDLAGLTCGACGTPFVTFAIATFLGKALVKAPLQAHALISAFSLGPALLDAALKSPSSFLRAAAASAHSALSRSQIGICIAALGASGSSSGSSTGGDGDNACNICCSRGGMLDKSACIQECALASVAAATPAFIPASTSKEASLPALHSSLSLWSSSSFWSICASLIAPLWSLFVLGLILWFLISLIEMIASEALLRRTSEKITNNKPVKLRLLTQSPSPMMIMTATTTTPVAAVGGGGVPTRGRGRSTTRRGGG